jgi:ssDNA-binding Zn-finger/Zn-ribbon topoisomerase 1
MNDLDYKDNSTKILGRCPRCLESGYPSDLFLVKGINENGKPFQFAKCTLAPKCSYTEPTINDALIHPIHCPICKSTTKPIIKKTNGQHYFLCEFCEKWYLADENFVQVQPPTCPKCNSTLVHKNRIKEPDVYFWACPNPDCRVTANSDKFGMIPRKNNSAENSTEST